MGPSFRARIASTILIISLLMMGPGADESVMALQAVGESTETEPAAPEFGINPASNAPDGYFEVELQPGDTQTIEAIVVNIGESDVELFAYAASAVNPPNGGFGVAGPEDLPTGATKWINVSDAEFLLEADSSTSVSAEIRVPADTNPGQYVTALVVSTTESLPIQGADNLRQVIRAAVPVVVVVPGEVKAAFEIGDPTAVRQPDGVVLDIPVLNTGNIRIQPAGTLSIRDSNETEVATYEISMDSVYSGNVSLIRIYFPSEIEAGEYSIDVSVVDPDTQVTATLMGAPISVEEPVEIATIEIVSQSVEANSKDIVFAEVNLEVINRGNQLPTVDLVLHVLKDGEPFEEFSLAHNQVLLSGKNVYSTRYIPAAGEWESGTYTFRVTAVAVDPSGQQSTQLIDEALESEIVVP